MCRRKKRIPAFPAPLQISDGSGLELEPFRDAHSFHPEDPAPIGFSHDQLPPPCGGNLRGAEQVLEFDGRFHADWLESIAGPPVPKSHEFTDGFGIKSFEPWNAGQRRHPRILAAADSL